MGCFCSNFPFVFIIVNSLNICAIPTTLNVLITCFVSFALTEIIPVAILKQQSFKIGHSIETLERTTKPIDRSSRFCYHFETIRRELKRKKKTNEKNSSHIHGQKMSNVCIINSCLNLLWVKEFSCFNHSQFRTNGVVPTFFCCVF